MPAGDFVEVVCEESPSGACADVLTLDVSAVRVMVRGGRSGAGAGATAGAITGDRRIDGRK
jgi:hypothetical protein